MPSSEGAHQIGNALTLGPSRRSERDRSKSQLQQVETCPTASFPGRTSSLARLHVEGNRVAAQKCRERKKYFIEELKSQEKKLAMNNEVLKHDVILLRNEMMGLRAEVLWHAECGLPAINEYIAQRISDILGVSIPPSLPEVTVQGQNVLGCVSTGDPLSNGSTTKCALWDDYICFDGLEDSNE